MDKVIFVPALLCLVGILRWGAQKTLLNICLPVLLLLPTYYYWRVQGFPSVDFGMSVLMPLGGAMLVTALTKWRFTRTDLWMALYIFSNAYADFRIGETSLAKYRLFGIVFTALIPYMAGKLLIENGARLQVVRRVVLLLAASCVVAIPEAFLKLNLFLRGWMHFFPGQWPGWSTQFRWGLGRVAGPCGSPELYGLVLIAGLLLLLWMRRWDSADQASTSVPWYHSRRTGLLLLATMLLTLFLTESRGPWFGMLLGFAVASIGRAKRVGRTALIAGVLCLVVAVPAYEVLKNYSSGPRTNYGSDRETAQYRSEMLANYLPVAERGGLWGWGTFHPVLAGQVSIDNEYLRVFLVQGYAGLVAYVLLICEALYSLARVGFVTESRQDRHFCFTMLGLMLGWALTLSTVYMGAQTYDLFFLVVGWTQMIPRFSEAEKEVRQQAPALRLNRVYT